MAKKALFAGTASQSAFSNDAPEVRVESNDIACLSNGAPHAAEVQQLVDLFLREGDHPIGDFVRCYISFELLQSVRKLRERSFEIAEYRQLLTRMTELAETLIANRSRYQDLLNDAETQTHGNAPNDVEASTRAHYGSLFSDFGDADYFEKSFEVLTERFDKNSVSVRNIEQKTALDCGCGAGRFSLALKRMGFAQVHGVDFSGDNVATAVQKRDQRGITGVLYREGNVLDLPFGDEDFDFALSYGVLHHTTDPERGLRELFRVLKAKGELFLFLRERPGGVLLDSIDIARSLMRSVFPGVARGAMTLFGVHGFRLYSILDHVSVPINLGFSPAEVEEMLHSAGFAQLRRLTRGLPSDQNELLHHSKSPDALWKYGAGENFYLCAK